MRLKKLLNFRIAFALVLGLSVMFSANTFAQETAVDSVAVEVNTSSDAQEEETTAAPALEKESTAKVESSSAAAASVNPLVEETTGLPAQVYINFFFYVLLFLLVCFIVGIVGKVMDIYGITKQLQGYDRSEEKWASYHGWFFLIGLFVFLYGVYWSYANHGAQSFREAATEHGAAIDVMFIITVIVTTIVLVLTHILLFGFAFQYRGSSKRKAYFYPHNNTLEKIWTIIPAIVLTIDETTNEVKGSARSIPAFHLFNS